MSKIPGVGYNPPPGQVFWIWPGSRESAGTTAFNPAAGDPFGTGEAGTLDLDVFNARYGGRPVRADGTIGNFVVDAETVLGALTRAMELAAAKGVEPAFSGRPETHTMVPTIREAHDYAATHDDGGRSLMAQMGIGGGASGQGASQGPGQPRIESLDSPAPGRVSLAWKTGPADSFEIQTKPTVGTATTRRMDDPRKQDPRQSNTRSATIDLPDGHGGLVEVSVRAFRGETGGKWSRASRVTVEPRQGGAGKPEPPTEEVDITADRRAMEALQLLKSRGYTKEQITAAWESV